MSDQIARVLTGLAVLAVAVIAAAVSFAHIESLGLAHGYTGVTARLLPLSVDGLIVVSSMTLLTEARAQRPAPRLARFGLVLGIAGTLAANVAYGVHFGPVGALVNAWPAAAFITATEILVGQMRRAGGIPSREEASETVASVPGPVSGDVAASVPVDVPPREVSPTGASTAQTVADAVLPDVTPDTPETRARMAEDAVPSSIPASVPRVPHEARVRRSRGRAPARKAQSPERVFAAEISRGELPSLRAIKTRMHVGTDKARSIRDDLSRLLAEEESIAA